MLGSGYVQIARFRGIPIRAHWTMPFLCLLWSGLRFAPGAWIGALFVVLLHELGHAYLARRHHLHVVEVMLHGLGGHCAYLGEPSPWQRAVVASGGVLAQAILLAIALPAQYALTASAAGGVSPPDFLWDLLYAWTWSNLGIAVFNLMPLGRLDGVEIWKLPGLWLARRRRRALGREAASTRSSSASAPRVSRAEAVDAPAREAPPEPLSVDEDAVRETVRRALEEARRSSQRGP